MIVAALIWDGRLTGIFSSMELAAVAAKEIISQNQMEEWTKDEREHEIQYSKPGSLIVIDRWEVDRALVEGQWINLKDAK